MIETELCTAARNFLMKDVNAKLATFPITTTIHPAFLLGYGLVVDPAVADEYIDVSLKAFWQPRRHSVGGVSNMNGSDWWTVGEYNYHLLATNVTWTDAKRQCTGVGATLPVIRKYDHLMGMMQEMETRSLKTIAVGITRQNMHSSFYYIDTGDTAPCWGWSPYQSNATLANTTMVALSSVEGYVNVDNQLTNAVCRMSTTQGGVEDLPCSKLLHYTWKCENGSVCYSVKVIAENSGVHEGSMVASLGYVFMGHLPGITLSITEMTLSNANISYTVRAVNVGQVEQLLRLGFVYGAVVGYVLASAKGLTCALSIHLCWNDQRTPNRSLFTFHRCARGWTEMGTVYTLCGCANNCCNKLTKSVSREVACDALTTSTSSTTTTTTTSTTSTTTTSTTTTSTTSTSTSTTSTSTSTTSTTSTTTPTTTTTTTTTTTPTTTTTSTTTPTTTSTTIPTTTTPTTTVQATTTETTTLETTTITTTTETMPTSPPSTEPEPSLPPLPVDDKVETVVTVLSSLGSIIVVGTMVSIIFIFILLKDFSMERLIHMNQEIALTLAHILVMAIKERKDANTTFCAAVAVGLQCLFYAHFSLLLLESIHIYAILTNVADRGGVFPRADSVVVAWAVPIIATAACARAYFYDYPSRWTCWLNWDHPTLTKVTVGSIMVTFWLTLIFTEAAVVKRYPPLVFANKRQRLAARINQKGVATLAPLSLAAWFVGSQAVHQVNVALYSLAFGLQVALAVTVFFFHALGSPKAHAFFKHIRTQIVEKMAVITVHYGYLKN